MSPFRVVAHLGVIAGFVASGVQCAPTAGARGGLSAATAGSAAVRAGLPAGKNGGTDRSAGGSNGGAAGSKEKAGSPGIPPVARVLSYSLIAPLRQDGWPVCGADGMQCDFTVKRTAPGYVHKTVGAGNELLKRLAAKHHFELTIYDGDMRDNVAQEFTREKLARYQAIVFNNPNGMGLSPAQREAFKGYINQGGGYVGIHAGINCENDWPWFHNFVGAFEVGVIGVTAQDLEVLPGISTAHLPNPWRILDEWHKHSRSVDTQPNIRVLLRRSGAPVAWYQELDGGRMWYTGLGHVDSTFQNAAFEEHVWGGIRWAARL